MRGRDEKRRRMAADYMARYDEYRAYLDARKEAIAGVGAIRYDAVGGGGVHSPVEISVEQLEKISMDFRAQIVETVNRAWELFVALVEYSKMSNYTQQEREIVKAALWLNLTRPMANRYEDFNQDTMPVCRMTFYKYRRLFLDLLADKIGL